MGIGCVSWLLVGIIVFNRPEWNGLTRLFPLFDPILGVPIDIMLPNWPLVRYWVFLRAGFIVYLNDFSHIVAPQLYASEKKPLITPDIIHFLAGCVTGCVVLWG